MVTVAEWSPGEDDETNTPHPAPDWLLAMVREPEGTEHTATGAASGVHAAPQDVDRDALPRRLQLLLAEAPAEGDDRSARFHHIALSIKEAGYSEGQAVTLLAEWCEFIDYRKALGRVPYLVHLSWSKHRAGLEIGPIPGYTPPLAAGSLALAAHRELLATPLPVPEPGHDPDVLLLPPVPESPELDVYLDQVFPQVDFLYEFEHVDDEPIWVWEPFAQRETSISLYSVAKAGKSLIALEAVAALCSGRIPPGATRARPPKHVAYFDRENPRRSLVKRLRAMGHKPEDFSEHLHYFRNPSFGFLDVEEDATRFVRQVHRTGAELVIIDTVSKFIEGEEDKAVTINRMDKYAIQPLTRMGIAVIRLDHAGKDETKGQRGSSAKAAIGDGSYALVRNGNYIKLTGSLRDDDSPEEILFIRRNDPLRHDPATEAEEAAYLAQLADDGKGDDAAPRKNKRGRPAKPRDEKLNAIIDKLDRCDVPYGAGSREALRLLGEAGETCDKNLIGAALRRRNDLAEEE